MIPGHNRRHLAALLPDSTSKYREYAFIPQMGETPGVQVPADYEGNHLSIPSAVKAHVRISLEGTTIAETTNALRIVDSRDLPSLYIPRPDVEPGVLIPSLEFSVCMWKGIANYYDVATGTSRMGKAAWSYQHPPHPTYSRLSNLVAFHPGLTDCYLDDVLVVCKPGNRLGH